MISPASATRFTRLLQGGLRPASLLNKQQKCSSAFSVVSPSKKFSSEAPQKSFMTDRSLLYRTSEESKYELGKHRSNALEMVMKQPVIEVDGDRAVCDGGGGALGHPVEYINVAHMTTPQACVYCGLRYIQRGVPH
mmetsp:Transcript_21100/g.30962  ORF Transcript_21100/g.30962 Transcript_21100/m.30962 type:complete len:136 (-) Transcript_21100:232-639(-)|eukprot:CAMPEP_0195516930 /NCGR_PEP_ID=MMETSP0794_2-20130614/9181_1 /TAXON_ID=515487 /ORGANISM="Stephanopyxis turris, Strain CCMP 815" /LENGTH=135 /DNA_ID=CAMNT_0040645647 /DNA_START=39 /DNA_END=446 /DNA_ORIENTATION=+